MKELIYARSPSAGEIELVVAKDHKATVYQIDDHAFAALFDAFADAARERLVRKISPSWETDPFRVARIEPFRHASRTLREPDYKDKSRRKYGIAPEPLTAIDGYGYYA
jgi:hypothetical protein